MYAPVGVVEKRCVPSAGLYNLYAWDEFWS
jgi:hypothetical protein